MMRPPSPARNAGIGLIEIVTTIAVTAILAAVVTGFLAHPIQGYLDLSRRATLVDSAESSLQRMTRDLRTALPNSTRITNIPGGGFALEMLPIVEGGKYCASTFMCNNPVLRFKTWARGFDNLGCFRDPTHIGTLPPDHRVVVNNLGTPGTDVYEDAGLAGSGPSVISTTATTISIAVYPGPGACGAGTPPDVNRHRISFDPWFRFKGAVTTNHRFFIVIKPVTYLCNPANGQLTRYADYPIQAAQPTTAAVLDNLSGVSSALITDNVDACSIATTIADVRNRSILTLALNVAREGEKVSLMRQVALDNSR
jgi:MSHA biogenesis protein MshO